MNTNNDPALAATFVNNDGGRYFALRDIEAGEEIRCDYSEIGVVPSKAVHGNSLSFWTKHNRIE